MRTRNPSLKLIFTPAPLSRTFTQRAPTSDIIYMMVEEFNWLGNSQLMYNKVCESSPFFVRHFTRNGLNKGLNKRIAPGGTVTESVMYDVCKEVTPEKYLENTLKILDQYKTT